MAELKKYDLLELPWTDVADYIKAGNDVVMIPVGSCEKHGHHVPLGVDSYTTMGSVERAAKKAKVLYAPLLPFGLSPHHMGEAGWGTGSISLPAEVYRQVLYAIGRSLIFAGFNKLVYVSHHGTNMGAQGEVLRTLRAETGCFCAYYKTPTERDCAVVADLMTGPPEETPGWHAGELETSTSIAYMKEKGIYEGSVFMERAKPDRAHAPKWMGPAFSKKDGTNTVIFQRLREHLRPDAPPRVLGHSHHRQPAALQRRAGECRFREDQRPPGRLPERGEEVRLQSPP